MARDETTPLLERTTGPEDRSKEQPASIARGAALIIFPYFLFALFAGAAATIEIEAIGQIACQLVVPVPVPTASGKERLEWEAMCRVAPDVLRRTSSVVTEILLIAGILSALTAAWWGGLSDRRGRRLILAATSMTDIVTNVVMILVLAYPHSFGFRWLLVSAVLSGLGGGQLASMAIGATYLSDLAPPESKTQVLSLYEAATFSGVAVGPLIGPYLMRIRGLGVVAPYVGLLLVRALFVLSLPFLRETRPTLRAASESCGASDSETSAAGSRSLLVRIVTAPVELVRPMKVLAPAKVDGRRDYRLPLVAASYALLMIIPGLGPVKIFYARGTFGWGPLETGRFITYTGALKLVVLAGLVPLAARLLRKAVPAPVPEGSADAPSESPVEALPSPSSSVWDLALAKTSIALALAGYLIMLIPTKTHFVPFVVGTAFTAFAAAAPPALLSLALAFSAPENSGKVLASLSALATVSMTAVGPCVFGSVYAATLQWWSGFVFLLAAMWVASSLVPLFGVKLRPDGRPTSAVV